LSGTCATDLPADETGQAGFVTAWGGVDGYLARMTADGAFTSIEAAPADPGGIRPRQAAGTAVTELDEGLLVRPAGSETPLQLNNTAAAIWELCDGQRTVPQVAAALADAFGLDHQPLTEATATIIEFHQAGLLTESGTYSP
jgi:pyrroloquinoline quinone biosynthesis protein D